MSEISANNKRIAKNTLMLYFRMLLMMGVTLYTSRVVLEVLGIEDYGIYNVVGGVVAMFTMISGSLSAAISRFITFELGQGDQEKLNQIFSASLVIQIIISAIIFILAETVGLWFIQNKMQIPEGRMVATQWVLHFSLATLVINLISVPYNATIIAHERMSTFAYISIVDVMGKLVMTYIIAISTIDRLITYSIAMFFIALLVRLIYVGYCRRNFKECRSISFIFDKHLFKDMFGFAGWNFIGSASGLLKTQGCNILLNLFYGAVVNAAMGISNQVTAAINQFSTNFMTALNPQITKSYATGNRKYMMTLIFYGSRLSFYMLLLLSLPILMQTDYIISIWLKEVPKHTVIFVKLSLVLSLMESISAPLITAMLATGRIRNYQIIVGGFQMLNLPVSYVFLRMGFFPEVTLLVAICLSGCCLLSRLYLLRRMIDLPARRFVQEVLINVFLVAVISVITPSFALDAFGSGFGAFVLISLITLASTATVIYFVGCTRNERSFLKRKIEFIINRKLNLV